MVSGCIPVWLSWTGHAPCCFDLTRRRFQLSTFYEEWHLPVDLRGMLRAPLTCFAAKWPGFLCKPLGIRLPHQMASVGSRSQARCFYFCASFQDWLLSFSSFIAYESAHICGSCSEIDLDFGNHLNGFSKMPLHGIWTHTSGCSRTGHAPSYFDLTHRRFQI